MFANTAQAIDTARPKVRTGILGYFVNSLGHDVTVSALNAGDFSDTLWWHAWWDPIERTTSKTNGQQANARRREMMHYRLSKPRDLQENGKGNQEARQNRKPP